VTERPDPAAPALVLRLVLALLREFERTTTAPPRVIRYTYPRPEIRCPVCQRSFKTRQGLGGHLVHAKDDAHLAHRARRWS
jgi:hypothetical protein